MHYYSFGQAWLYFGFAIGTFVHEIGHAVCAWLCRLQVRRISIGIGPVLLRRDFGKLHCELHLLPFSGFVSVRRRSIYWTSQLWLLAVGGLLGNCLLGIIILAGLWALPLPYSTSDALQAIVAAQVALVVFNSLPITVNGRKTDGKVIWLLWEQRRWRKAMLDADASLESVEMTE